jgi:hypothetical protein
MIFYEKIIFKTVIAVATGVISDSCDSLIIDSIIAEQNTQRSWTGRSKKLLNVFKL